MAPVAGRPEKATPDRLSPQDQRYIRSVFVTLEVIAFRCGVSPSEIRDWQQRSLFPAPTYVTADGVEWYSPRYSFVVRRARSRRIDFRTLFLEEFRAALAQLREDEPESYRKIIQGATGEQRTDHGTACRYWEEFLSGKYGACLRVPWVACIIRKEYLINRIDSLLRRPKPANHEWARQLRRVVDSLDRLELPFAEWDRIRFGGKVTRDIYIADVRKRFRHVFDRQAPRQRLRNPTPPDVSARAPPFPAPVLSRGKRTS
jgi:DNA-binding transcriptional MerR regulator